MEHRASGVNTAILADDLKESLRNEMVVIFMV